MVKTNSKKKKKPQKKESESKSSSKKLERYFCLFCGVACESQRKVIEHMKTCKKSNPLAFVFNVLCCTWCCFYLTITLVAVIGMVIFTYNYYENIEVEQKFYDYEDGIKSFHNFIFKIPDWKDSAMSYSYLNDSKIFKFPIERNLRFRNQKTESCFGHAPIQDDFYLCLRHNESAEMIDLKEVLQQMYPNETINRKFFDKGFQSFEFLQAIVLNGSDYKTVSFADVNDSHLRDYGTGLISKFIVENNFRNKDVLMHTGKFVHKRGFFCAIFHKAIHFCDIPYHAMVLIGIRIDSAGKKHFMVQNSWKEKSFIDIDLDYMESSGAKLHFVTTPQDKYNQQYRTIKSQGAEMDFEAYDKDVFEG